MPKLNITVDKAAGTLLDFLMNDDTIATIMEQFIKKMYPDEYERMANCPEGMSEDEWEGTPEYKLYYAATVEFHSKVLGKAIMGLCNDPLA